MTTLLIVTGLSQLAAIHDPGSVSSARTFQRVVRSPSNALPATKVVLPWSLCHSLEAEYLAVAVRLVFAAEAGPARAMAASRAPVSAPSRHPGRAASNRFILYPLLLLVNRRVRIIASRGTARGQPVRRQDGSVAGQNNAAGTAGFDCLRGRL